MYEHIVGRASKLRCCVYPDGELGAVNVHVVEELHDADLTTAGGRWGSACKEDEVSACSCVWW